MLGGDLLDHLCWRIRQDKGPISTDFNPLIREIRMFDGLPSNKSLPKAKIEEFINNLQSQNAPKL